MADNDPEPTSGGGFRSFSFDGLRNPIEKLTSGLDLSRSIDFANAIGEIELDDSHIRTAENTERVAEGMEDLVEVVRASLLVSQDMRDHAKAAIDAANRSSRNALIITWVSGIATVASLIVAIIALVIATSTGDPGVGTP